MHKYNKEVVLNDFDKLVSLYLNSNSDIEKNSIYSQMLFIYNIDSRLARNNKLFSYKPKNYSKILKEEEIKRRNRYLDLDNLTRTLCFNLNLELDKFYPLWSSIIINNEYEYNDFLNVIEEFLSKLFPYSLELFNSDIKNGNIIIRRDLFFSSANIFYLESIKKYYIMIDYYKKLNAFNIASVIHEYGHASTFISNESYESKDYILNEVISYLYELVFLDYYLRKYGNENNYKEIIRVFNFSCIIKLKNHLSKNYKYNHNTISMIESLYGQVIGTSIYIKYRDSDILEKIKFLQENYSKVDGFELLKSIDISEEDLIDTSSDISKLVLRR